MDRIKLLLACCVLGAGVLRLVGQEPTPLGVFTPAQAEAGRVAYEKTCGKCHTTRLLGRRGDAGELPPVSSLSATYQEFIQAYGPVPPLAGKDFTARWGSKTVAQLISRFQEAVNAFPPDGMTDATTVEITAYALQVSGAKAGSRRLTRASDVTVSSITH